MSGLNASRADSIVGGSIVAEAVLEACRCGRFLVAGPGLREGVRLGRSVRPGDAGRTERPNHLHANYTRGRGVIGNP